MPQPDAFFVTRRTVIGLLWIVSVSQAFLSGAEVATTTAEAELVKEALHREIYGLHGEREQLLQAALRINPDFGPAQWQSGRPLHQGRWTDLDTLTANATRLSPTADEYCQAELEKILRLMRRMMHDPAG